jgi:hypothetical protein
VCHLPHGQAPGIEVVSEDLERGPCRVRALGHVDLVLA